MDNLTFRKDITLGMLHGEFHPGAVNDNVNKLVEMINKSLEERPDVILTPELAVSGYGFFSEIGLDWIKDQTPEITQKFKTIAKNNKIAIILGTPVYDFLLEKYFNSMLFIDQNGEVLGEHRKVNVTPGSTESWSTAGNSINIVHWNNSRIGMLICGDVYTEKNSKRLAELGANVIFSSANWGPGLHEPNGEWEKRSIETGLPVIVCNRTGAERQLNFTGSSSVAINQGQRLIDYNNHEPAILILKINAKSWLPLNKLRVLSYS